MIISFAWTTPALVLGEKTETRRSWQPGYRARGEDHMAKGLLFHAYDRSPRHKGQEVGLIKVHKIYTAPPNPPTEAWEAEGFHVLQAIGAKVGGMTPLDCWLDEGPPQTVIRFEIHHLTPYGEELRDMYQARLDAAGGPVSLEQALAEHHAQVLPPRD